MRVAAVIVLAACHEPEGAFDPSGAVREAGDGTHVELHRRKVPLAEMPIVAQTLLGLPMSGLADVDIDLLVPFQWSRARGTIAVSCPTGCALGDGLAKLELPKFGPIDFGTLAADTLDIRIAVANGKLALTRWELVSPDVAIMVRFKIDLEDNVEASKLDGCVRYRPAPGLLQRDPKMHAMLLTTGAWLDRDGFYTIEIGGTIGDKKLLAHACRI